MHRGASRRSLNQTKWFLKCKKVRIVLPSLHVLLTSTILLSGEKHWRNDGGRLDVFLHFLNSLEHRGGLFCSRYLRYRIFSRSLLSISNAFSRRSIYPLSLFSLLQLSFCNLSAISSDDLKKKIRKKQRKETARRNGRIKLDFVRLDIKFDAPNGKHAIKSERKFTGNAIAATINTYIRRYGGGQSERAIGLWKHEQRDRAKQKERKREREKKINPQPSFLVINHSADISKVRAWPRWKIRGMNATDGEGGGGNVSGNSIIVRRVWERKGRLTDSAIASQNSVSPRMLNGKISKGDEFIRVAVSWIPSHRDISPSRFFRFLSTNCSTNSPISKSLPYLSRGESFEESSRISRFHLFIQISVYRTYGSTGLKGMEGKKKKGREKEN